MDAPLDIHALRNGCCKRKEPSIDETVRDPMKLFDIWFKNVAAQKTLSYEERNAVFFSTVGKDMKPSSRTVLLQAYDVDGFSIYTSYDSRKARELQENPNACMLFYWPVLNRQVRVEGKVSKLPKEAAIEHWNSLPLAIRIVLKSNEQSAVIPNEEYLENKRRALQKLAAKEGERSITKPECWGGYLLSPDYVEFWQGKTDWRNERLGFRKNGKEWTMQRLSP